MLRTGRTIPRANLQICSSEAMPQYPYPTGWPSACPGSTQRNSAIASGVLPTPAGPVIVTARTSPSSSSCRSSTSSRALPTSGVADTGSRWGATHALLRPSGLFAATLAYRLSARSTRPVGPWRTLGRSPSPRRGTSRTATPLVAADRDRHCPQRLPSHSTRCKPPCKLLA